MDRFGMDFDEALKEAQALGYAEADPTADIGGFDVANKAVISASVACGAPFKDDFPVLGIEKVTKSFLDDLKREGKTLRHMMLLSAPTTALPWALRLLCFRSNHLKHRCAATATA